jgi:hypothetical protein
MNLILPTPTETPGPTYATQNNTAFETVDSHDHTTGAGVQVPTAGINIDADLNFNAYNATVLRSSRFDNRGSALGESTDIGCTYVAGGNLFFNDISGTQIQLTAGGALNAASIGGVGGDYSTSSASVYYQLVDETFYFTSDTNTPATINMGSAIIREPAASAPGITIKSPAALGSGYDVTLPTALPASTRVLSMTSAGTLVPGSTGAIVTADLADLAVTTAKIADTAVTTAKIIDSSITNSKIADGTILNAKLSDGTITGQKVSTSINLPGTNVQAAGWSLAVMHSQATSEYSIIPIEIAAHSGGAWSTSGTGWSATGDSNTGTGTITYLPAFSGTPYVFVNNFAVDNSTAITISASVASSVNFTCFNGINQPAFNLLVMGPR